MKYFKTNLKKDKNKILNVQISFQNIFLGTTFGVLALYVAFREINDLNYSKYNSKVTAIFLQPTQDVISQFSVSKLSELCI